MIEDTILSQIMDNISEGIIAIDKNGIIKVINERAKEIFGIKIKQGIGHKKGKIEKGDVVIIGNSSVGLDDGGMKYEDFMLLGINEKIPENSAFAYIGRYNEGGEYIFVDKMEKPLRLSKIIDDKKLEVEIDRLGKVINIKSGDISFPYSYVKGIGHIVILDKDTLEVKFYQSKGYTVRKEDLKNILNGKNYMEKLPGEDTEYDVISKDVKDVLGKSKSIKALISCAKGKEQKVLSEFDEINGRPVRCSVYPILSKKLVVGAYILIEDMSEINRLLKERDEFLGRILQIQDIAYNPFELLVGESYTIKKIKDNAKRIALSNSNVLILGESGTGKSLLARAIHVYSNRKTEKFVEINCGALSETLLESELFGYVPGAFTGANREGKIGLVEYANGGTLFLDEICEMPLNLQVKLLHVLQNRQITPVGGTKPKDIDVRFICATNKDILELVKAGKFREDLYYRINVMSLELPPLRDRKEDLPLLCQSIISRICSKNIIPLKQITDKGIEKLYQYNFPGNIRELENILERSLYFSEGKYINDEDIILNYRKTQYEGNYTLKEIVEETEKRVIKETLQRFGGDKQKAMEALGVKKTSFYEKLKKYEM
ncbi:ATPase AAA [Fervidicella metallireducens AeB]|uniref:ATPase AAA n=1 Tax=Fervidicella metallireducens AeB TaxID=1403537 RepID=A0A017RU68_9CLOT|nr:sigma 54-interacting transcriptional regulator [Fervidicella metallireducens]EYE88222.1 ATPase AAA [Fervidicella metallireducens AeB]